MSLKNQASKKASTISKAFNKQVNIKLSDSAFSILAESINKNNMLQQEAQKAGRELQNNLLIAIEGAGHKVEYFKNVNLNPETKELILDKK